MSETIPPVSADESGDPRSVRLRQVKRLRSDQYQNAPGIFRSRSMIDEKLRGLFSRLVDGQEAWPLYLHGAVGVGKTRAVLALCDFLECARYWTIGELMDAMDSRKPRIAPWLVTWGWNAPGPALAVLDELGTHDRATDFEYDAVKRFADWREDQPAIYVSNHKPELMTALYDERVASRLTCGTIHELTDPDRRKPEGD